MRLRLLLAVVAVSALPGIAPAGPIYLALGDSSAFGETDRTRNPSDGDRGYVAPFADYLGSSRYPARPTVVNLALDGETSVSWATGLTDRASPDGIFHNSNYASFAPNYPTQQERFRQTVADANAAGNQIDTVTVQFGANDLFVVAEKPGFTELDPSVQTALVYGQIGALQQNYAAILSEVWQALPDAELYVIGYHNPFPGLPDHPLTPLSAPATQGINQVAEAMAEAFGGTYVSFYDVIFGKERELTLIQQDANVHLNDAGYAAASAELIRVASTANTPEPASITLVAVGLFGALGYRGVRRVRAA